MAVKAVCVLNGTVGRHAGDHTKFYVGVNYAVLDDAEPPLSGTTYFYNLDSTMLGSLLTTTIEGQMKTFLQGLGANIGALDSVQLLTALV